MFAKFGLSSPFSKRKNKDLQHPPSISSIPTPNSNNSQTILASVTNTNQVTGIPVKQQCVSNIPMPKKFQSFLPSLMTPQVATTVKDINSNNSSCHSINSSIASSGSNIAISRNNQIKLNQNERNSDCSQNEFVSSESSSGISSGSNKTTSNSSRSSSPTTSVESGATISIGEMNTKQSVKSIAQVKENVAKQQQQQLKKSGLPKGLTNKLYNSPSPITPANSSKLQSISNSSMPNCSNDSKTTTGATIKKFGSSIKSSNIFGLNSKSTNTSQTNMPNLTQSVKDSSSNSLSSVSTSSIKSSNNTIKKTSNSNLSTTSSNSSCNIPKLTKINDNSVNNNNHDSTSSNISTNNSNIRKLQYPTISPSSKIPNCTIVKKMETSNIKPITVKSLVNENETHTQSSCRQTALKPKIPVEGNLMSKSMNSNLPNLIYSKASSTTNKTKLSTNDNILLKKPIVNQNDATKNEKQLSNNCSSSSNIARVPPFIVDKNEEIPDKKDENTTNSSEFNQEIHLLKDLTIDSSTQPTVNHMSPNGYPSDKDLSTYARKIQKRFKDGMQAVKESMQFALSDEDFSDQHQQNLNDNKNIYVSLNHHQDDKKQITYSPSSSTKQSPNNSLKSNKKNFNDLIVQANNNNQMIQNFLNGTTSYSPKHQSVRSNTLDRKFRQSLQIDHQNSSSSFKLFSSSLERNKHQQHQQLMMYDQQSNDFLSKSSQEYFSLNENKKSSISKKQMNKDIILENPNTISLSISNDDLVKQLNSPQKPSYNEELLNKDKEIINLKLELEKARNRILTMTNQLNNNAHIVTTLEQNLSNLTLKSQTLSINVQRKDKKINELKSYLEILCSKYPKIFENEKLTPLVRHNSTESMASLNSVYSQRSFQSTSEVETNNGKKKRSWLRSSFIKAFNRKKKQSSPPDSISETSSNKRYSDIDENQSNQFNVTYSLPTSPIHQQILNDNCLTIKSNSKLTNTINDEDFEDMERKLREKESKLTDIQLEALASAHQLDQLKDECIKMKLEMNSLRDENIRLKMLVNENSPNNNSFSELSDIRNKSPNKSLDKIIKSMNNSETSDKESDRLIKRIEECKSINNDIISQSFKDGEGKRVVVSIYCGDQKLKFDDILMDKDKLVIIGNLSINTRTKWDILDSVVKNLLKEYLVRLDSKHNQQQVLGLTVDSSLSHYYVGDMLRSKDVTQNPPDLLPYGYLVGDYTNITICLKDAGDNFLDNLCFETLVPKNILQRYVSLLTEYKHLLLCGQTGTGKSFIAKKIAKYLIKRHNNKNGIEYFNVENKSSKDLKQFLSNLVEQKVIPFVIILDNLHNIANISETFNEFFNFKNTRKIECFVIGTVNHPNITSLNFHENFKWILCINQAEPVNNYLSRYLERCLVEYEVNSLNKNQQELSLINSIVHWVPKLWQYLNKYIETYNSADVTLGPKLFTNVPMDVNEAKFWFIELWNHSLVPYIIETILEGVQAYGIELKWEDPKVWILDTCPWKFSETEKNNLRSIRAADVGCEIENEMKPNNELTVQNFNKKNNYDATNNHVILNEGEDSMDKVLLSTFTSPSKSNLSTKSLKNSGDNLINMLMRLQEVTMGNQPKRSVSNRIMNEKNLSINTNMILTMPKSVESAL